jgi:hypothetical protein
MRAVHARSAGPSRLVSHSAKSPLRDLDDYALFGSDRCNVEYMVKQVVLLHTCSVLVKSTANTAKAENKTDSTAERERTLEDCERWKN